MKTRKYSLKYNNEMYEFLCKKASSHTIKQLAKMVSENFNINIESKKLAQYCIKMGIKYKYESPKRSHSNKCTDNGTIVVKTDGNYIKVKTDKHKWDCLHRVIYQKYHNVKLPNDVYVIFLDQNRRNFDIKNLKAISRRSSAIMSRYGLFSTEPKVTKLGHLCSKVKIKIKEIDEQ